jgi:hypothetical protein
MKPQDRTRAILRSGLPSTHRLIAIALMDYADASDQAWPSVATVARDTGLNERTVRRALKALEGRCLILIGHRSGCRVFQFDRLALPGRAPAPSGRSARSPRAERPIGPSARSLRAERPLPPGAAPDEATREATKEATSSSVAKSRPVKRKARKKKKEPEKLPGYAETIAHWQEQTQPWVHPPATRYPWVFQGQNHDGSKVKRWLRAAQSLEHLKEAINRYVAACHAGTTWPKGEPPMTKHFDRDLARWLLASSSKPNSDKHWMNTGEGVGAGEDRPQLVDTSSPSLAASWLDGPIGASFLFTIAQEFGDGPLPAQDYPPRHLWLDGMVTHPAIVWAELKRRRGQAPLVVVS